MSNVTRCTIHVENFYEKQEYIFEEIDHNIFSIPSFIRLSIGYLESILEEREYNYFFYLVSITRHWLYNVPSPNKESVK
jgi:hypothetical protein